MVFRFVCLKRFTLVNCLSFFFWLTKAAKRKNLRIMIDLPLINEDACVFWNEVAIKRCVFWGAGKKDESVIIFLHSRVIILSYTIVLHTLWQLHVSSCVQLLKKKNRSYQWGIVKGRKDEWRKDSIIKASSNGKFCLSERRGVRSRPTFSSVNREKFKNLI